MGVSIIIPTVNEAGCIAEQVRRCRQLSPRPEVIVADGMSGDGTPRLAGEAGAAVVACGGRGRARQMNEGARQAAGEILLFLHADVILEQPPYSAMLDSLRDEALVGGAFRRRFDSPSPLLDWGCRLADFRGRAWGVFLGDQAIFARRDVFWRLGGFGEMLLFEDFAFSRAMRHAGPTRLIPEPILASGRRFRREGSLRRLAKNLYLTALYLAGADPNRLARRYYPGYFAEAGMLRRDRLAGRGALGGGP